MSTETPITWDEIPPSLRPSFRMGTWWRTRSDIADHYMGTSVIVPKGTAAQLTHFERRKDRGSTWYYAWFEMRGSPGQPQLTTEISRVDRSWEPLGGPPKPIETLWERLLSD